MRSPSAAFEYMLYQTLIGTWPLQHDDSFLERKRRRWRRIGGTWVEPPVGGKPPADGVGSGRQVRVAGYGKPTGGWFEDCQLDREAARLVPRNGHRRAITNSSKE